MSDWLLFVSGSLSRAIRFCGGLCQHRARPVRAGTSTTAPPVEAPSDSESEFSLVTGPGHSTTRVAFSPGFVAARSIDQPLPVIELSPAVEFSLLTAASAQELGELFPEGLAEYRERRIGELGRPGRIWSLEARAARALRAGVAALRVLNGVDRFPVKTPAITATNTIYIVLRWRGTPAQWWCRDFAIYSDHIRGPAGFQQGSVSHAFRTEAEAELYLIGAQRRWPLEVHPGSLSFEDICGLVHHHSSNRTLPTAVLVGECKEREVKI